jgi:hypothetical protein
MSRAPPWTLPALPLALVLAVPLSAADKKSSGTEERSAAPKAGEAVPAQQSVREVLARFDKGDPGWKVRMQALVTLARSGPDAVPVLVEALEHGTPSAREFAAQVLAVAADPGTRPALERALSDPEPGVRIYAIKALSLSGRLVLTEPQGQRLKKESRAYWMREYIDQALQRHDTPAPAAIRKALADYDLALLDRARLGQVAPDFALADGDGRTHRLSQFRGRNAVVLEFNSGDG